jgi:oligopeptide transport system ATP-binding protein
VMGLLPPRVRVAAGQVKLHDLDMVTLPEEQRRRLRGPRLAMVFQDALAALNPVLNIGYQVGEPFVVHRGWSRRRARAEAVRLLERVGIPSPGRRIDDYPHQLSGGMRQRVMIAMAIALQPDLLVADEPTTSLDVTVQAQLLELLRELQDEQGTALLLITHDMGVVAEMADRVMVMYSGRVVEAAPVDDLLDAPRHPYTRALIDAIPNRGTSGRSLPVIPGAPPDPARRPAGCSFASRCRWRAPICATVPPLTEDGDRAVACHRWQDVQP